MSSALFSSENEKSESEEKFKRLVQVLPSNVSPLCPIEFQWVENSEIHDSVADEELAVDHQEGRQKE